MKLVITESQLNAIVREQISTLGPVGGYDYQKPEAIMKSGEMAKEINPHLLLDISGIITSFIPVVGPYISMGIGLTDASIYYKEGDKKTAALVSVFSMLPLLGKVALKIPGVKEFGVKAMGMIGSKLSKGAKLTESELRIVNQIKANSSLIKQEISQVGAKIKPIVEEVKVLKPKYISKFGQSSYEKLFGEYISGVKTAEQFTQTLSVEVKNASQAVTFVSKAGIKFFAEETKGLKNIANKISGLVSGDHTTLFIDLTVNGQKQTCKVIYKFFEKNTWLGLADDVKGIIYLNSKYLEGQSLSKIEEVIFHEASHIKDPAKVSEVFQATYSAIKGNEKAAAKMFEFFFDNFTNLKSSESLKMAENAKNLWKYWYERYLTHPMEITANNNMVLNRMVSTTEELLSKVGAQQTKSALENILSVVKNNEKIDDLGIKILGDAGIEHMTALYNANKQAYNKFLGNLYKQVTNLKQQLNLL